MGQIFGAIALTPGLEPGKELKKMEDYLSFWQADAQSRYADEHAAIGNRLLFNTPESHLEQLPLICPQQRYVLSCVARLDNREELAPLLGYAPDTIDQIPDGRFILDAFIKWQESCVQHLIGDFAIAVWDKAEQKLFLARDPIGVKPLFYTQTEHYFLFASDMNAFKAHIQPVADLNEDYLAHALANQPNPIPATCYTNVSRLIPAQYYVLENGRLSATTYWELKIRTYPELKTETDYYNRFRELLHEAVRCRLRTTGNIGCELSGGLDSSAITVLAARLLGEDVSRLHTLSYVMPEEAKAYDDNWVDEEPEQEATIAAANIPRRNVHKLTHAWFDNPFDELDYATEVSGGISDTDSYWTEALRRKAHGQQVRVILSGFPGDELVSASGGAWFFDLVARKEYRQVWSLIRKKPMERLKGLASFFFKKYIHYSEPKDRVIQQQKTDFLSPVYKRKYFHTTWLQTFQPDQRIFRKERITRPHTCLRMESEGLYALRNQIETRYPLADVRLIEFVYNIPPIFYKDATQSRHFFRKATEGILPDKVRLRQNKKGAPLIFGRLKHYKHQKVLLAHYQPAGPYPDMIHMEKLLKTVQDNLNSKKGDAPRAIRFVFWLMRLSEHNI